MKREIRRRMAASVMQRPENKRYEKSNRLDDLVAIAEKKRKKRNRGKRGFSTMFPVPSSASAGKNHVSSIQAGSIMNQGTPNKDHIASSSLGMEVSSTRLERASIPLRERIEILVLALCVTYSAVVETGEDMGYWSKKICFAVTVALLFIVNRLDAGSTAYYFDPRAWQGGFRFATAFSWALSVFSAAKTSSSYNFVLRTGVGAVTFAARYEALPRLFDAAIRWKRASTQYREVTK